MIDCPNLHLFSKVSLDATTVNEQCCVCFVCIYNARACGIARNDAKMMHQVLLRTFLSTPQYELAADALLLAPTFAILLACSETPCYDSFVYVWTLSAFILRLLSFINHILMYRLRDMERRRRNVLALWQSAAANRYARSAEQERVDCGQTVCGVVRLILLLLNPVMLVILWTGGGGYDVPGAPTQEREHWCHAALNMTMFVNAIVLLMQSAVFVIMTFAFACFSLLLFFQCRTLPTSSVDGRSDDEQQENEALLASEANNAGSRTASPLRSREQLDRLTRLYFFNQTTGLDVSPDEIGNDNSESTRAANNSNDDTDDRPANIKVVGTVGPSVRQDLFDDNVCAICFLEYSEGAQLRELPCRHAFHAECVDQWLRRHSSTCPMCRKRVRATT